MGIGDVFTERLHKRGSWFDEEPKITAFWQIFNEECQDQDSVLQEK
jgi:hypothetical protein